MKKLSALMLFFVIIQMCAFAQFKSFEAGQGPANATAKLITPENYIPERSIAKSSQLISNQMFTTQPTREEIINIKYRPNGTANWIETSPWQTINPSESITRQALDYIEFLKNELNVQDAFSEFKIVSQKSDEQGNIHLKFQQMYHELHVDGGEIMVHKSEEGWNLINGFTHKTPNIETIPTFQSEIAKNTVKKDLRELGVRFTSQTKVNFLEIKTWESELVILYSENQSDTPKLAWKLSVRPNMKDHYIYYVDATDGKVIEYHNHICSFIDHHTLSIIKKSKVIDNKNSTEQNNSEVETSKTHLPNKQTQNILMDGPTVANDNDLFGSSRTVNAYQVSNVFYMVDASRVNMFQNSQSVMPDDPVGSIWTIDASGTSPENDNFSISHAANNNNDWKPLEVSAHHNGGVAYQYFLNTFGRVSINGQGGNIVSIINVTDMNENETDNAFWNGYAIFYGNGLQAFSSPLAKGIDVAGHEMSHGVIQSTANLEYKGQSGALNESFADVFGAMIDRNDWQIGEDVVNSNIFTTGALRDLSNPNNGGNSLNDPGWQPAHMNQFQNLPNTPMGDNGGVHINSGIANKAFFNFASMVGKVKAEKVYFKALEDYLVKSSQFVDARNAVVKAAGDLYGTTEIDAAKDAFNQVGIGEGSGEDYQEDLNTNPGQDVVICTDAEASAFYYVPPGDVGMFETLTELTPPLASSRMSMTDDGSAGVYVDNAGDLILVNFDWSNGLSYTSQFLESVPQGGWRNIVISKDGSKVAYQTAELDKRIFIFDFILNDGQIFNLFNPTTGGASTGDIQYADALEFDYSGEVLVYDALNSISGSFGQSIVYWDISFLSFFDNNTNSFVEPQIGKLFTSLPESISVGNPTFAKNSPFILAFDFLEESQGIFGTEFEYILKAANLETGRVSDVFLNDIISYPSFSRLDNKILFDANDNTGAQVLATIDLQPDDKIAPIPNTAFVFIEGGSKGTWSQTGERSLNTGIKDRINDLNINLYPNPVTDFLIFEGDDILKIKSVDMFDFLGKSVFSKEVNQHKIDLSFLPNGIYTLSINTEEGVITRTIIKQDK